MAPVSPPTSPRACGRLAAHRFVRLLQQADQPGGDRRGGRPDPAQRQGGLGPHRRRVVGQGRLQRRHGQLDRVAEAVPARHAFSTRRTTRSHALSSRGLASRGRVRAGPGPRAAEDPQRFDHALPHHVAGVLGERGQRGDRVQGVEVAERGGGDGPHVLVRVVQMTDQGRDGRGADRRQDQRQLVPLLLGQRRDGAQRHQQRPDGQGPVRRAARSGPLVDRLVRAPEIGDRLRQQFPLPQRGEDLMQQHQGEEQLEPGQQRGGRPGGLMDERGPQDVVRLGQVQHVHDAQEVREGIRQEIGVDRLPALVRDLDTSSLPMVS